MDNSHIINFPQRPKTALVTLHNPITGHSELLSLPKDTDQVELGINVARFANQQNIAFNTVRVTVDGL